MADDGSLTGGCEPQTRCKARGIVVKITTRLLEFTNLFAKP